MEYQHYIVSGYMETDGSIVDRTTIEIFAENEEAALSRVKKLIQKEHYIVTRTNFIPDVPELSTWSRVTSYGDVPYCSHCGTRFEEGRV